MKLLITGVSHKTAPVEVRECLAFREESLPAALADLKSRPGISEAVILSTCNRVEITVTTEDQSDPRAIVDAFLAGRKAAGTGDIGPADRIGEGSVALAENLGIRSNARNGGARGGILYLVFPGSGNGQPRTADEINVESEKLLETWGGIPQLTACMVQQSSPPLAGN